MAYFFGDGFDCYTVLTDCGTYWDASFGGTATLALSASGRFAGSRGVVTGIATTGTPYISKTSGVNDAVHHISLAIQQTSAITGTNLGFSVTFTDSATVQCSLAFRSDGALLLTNAAGGGGTTLATYTGAIAAQNTWYQFEVEVVINNTTGSIAVRKNGNTSNDFSATSLNTRGSANNYANKMGIGGTNSAAVQVVDDLLWRSDASSVAWAGDVRCYTRMPAADSSVAWTPSNAAVPFVPFAFSSNVTAVTTTAQFTPFTPNISGAIGSVSITTGGVDAGNMKCSIFGAFGAAPGTPLGSATPLNNLPAGANTFTFGTPVSVTAGTQYYVGFITDTAATGVWPRTASATVGQSQASTTYAAFPTTNPSTTATYAIVCTINITVAGGATHASMVNEPQQDGAGTYNYSSTVSQSDLYTLQSIGSTPSSILAVTTRGYLQKSDAGSRAAAVQIQSGTINAQASPLTLAAGSWGWNWRTDTVDPATSAAWTASGVNAATIGVVVTT